MEELLEFKFAERDEEQTTGTLLIAEQLAAFEDFGRKTDVLETSVLNFDGETVRVPTYVNEFWTAKQRAANRLHEVSYRACFKPQLPRFFIERLSNP